MAIQHKIFTALIFFICLIPLFANAKSYKVKDVPNDRLQNAADFVSNPDQIISDAAEQRINAILAENEKLNTAEIAVVLLGSIGDEDIDNFGTALFTAWGIGKNDKDNGLLFLLVYDQRQMIFRTGYGLEGVLPDVVLSRIIRNDISPKLQNGDFDGGIYDGIVKVCELLKNPDAVEEIKSSIKSEELAQERFYKSLLKIYLGISLLVLLGFAIFLLWHLFEKKSTYKKYLALNEKRMAVLACALFFPITMILFALLFFFVLKKLRDYPLTCLDCGRKMRRLSEEEDNKYLTPKEDSEEKIGSIDYDVWICDNCNTTTALPYDKPSTWQYCPNCNAKTYHLADDRILKRPSELSQGRGEREYSCVHCGLKKTLPYVIPMLILSSTSRSGRGGSFGGGSFGGSWGGGATGGGGARGGW
jgi:uncharacterized protein